MRAGVCKSASNVCLVAQPSDVDIGNLQAFIDSSPEQLQRVVSTNMVGTLLCTRAAMQVMQKQNGGGHIFNMDGAGADGMPTPQYAAYGATKAGAVTCHRS